MGYLNGFNNSKGSITKRILTGIFVVMVMYAPHAYAGPTGTLRPPSTVRGEQMPQEQAEAVVRQLVEQVCREFDIPYVPTPPLQKFIQYYAAQLRRGAMSAEKIYGDFFLVASQEADIMAHAQPLSGEQDALARETDDMVDRFLEPYGIAYRHIPIVCVPDELMFDGRNGSLFLMHATIVVSEGSRNAATLIHERLHSIAFGFVHTRLDEGMAGYLTTRLFMDLDGVDDVSRGTIRDYYYKSRGVYEEGDLYESVLPDFFDVDAIFSIVESIGDERPLVQAYLTGDMHTLEAALEPGILQQIELWASRYEDALTNIGGVDPPVLYNRLSMYQRVIAGIVAGTVIVEPSAIAHNVNGSA
jgi:hypothetical protein